MSWGKLGFAGQRLLPLRVSPGSLPPRHARACTPLLPQCFRARSRGARGAPCSLQGGFGQSPWLVGADVGTEAPGEAQQSFTSAVPGPPGKASGTAPHGVPRPSLLAACHAEGTAQKQPASLRGKPASVSIATVRDGGTHRGAAWPVSRVLIRPCHPGSRTGCGWVSSYRPGGGRGPPAWLPWGRSCVGGGTWER